MVYDQLEQLIGIYNQQEFREMAGEMNAVENLVQELKIISVGDVSVGKTSILISFIDKKYILNTNPTIGVDFRFKDYRYKEKNYQLMMFDTAGHERYRSITRKYYTGTQGIILVFDLCEWYDLMYPEKQTVKQMSTQTPSQKKIVRRSPSKKLEPLQQIQSWIQELHQHGLEKGDIVLVGNKLDQIQKNQRTPEFLDYVQKATEKYQALLATKCFFTSALTGKGVDDTVDYLIGKIYNRHKAEEEQKKQFKTLQPPQDHEQPIRNSLKPTVIKKGSLKKPEKRSWC